MALLMLIYIRRLFLYILVWVLGMKLCASAWEEEWVGLLHHVVPSNTPEWSRSFDTNDRLYCEVRGKFCIVKFLRKAAFSGVF